MYLAREGYRIESVWNGEAALGAVERFHPALVVLDVMLPKLDGDSVMLESVTGVGYRLAAT